MTEFDPASRFSLTDAPQRQPAMDFLTNSTVGPFVDTHIELDRFSPLFAEVNRARVYLSVETVKELAIGCGLFDPFEDALRTAYKDGVRDGLEDGRKIVEKEHGTARDLVAQLSGLGLAATPVVVVPEAAPTEPAPVGGAAPVEPTALAGDGEASARVEPAAPAAAKRAPRQGNGAPRNNRSARVPSGAGDDSPFRI